MIRVDITITKQQLAALKKLKENGGLSVSESIRRAIDEYLERIKRQ